MYQEQNGIFLVTVLLYSQQKTGRGFTFSSMSSSSSSLLGSRSCQGASSAMAVSHCLSPGLSLVGPGRVTGDVRMGQSWLRPGIDRFHALKNKGVTYVLTVPSER